MRFKIWREKPGVISPGPVWVCGYDGYLHIEDTLYRLLWSVVTEWNATVCGAVLCLYYGWFIGVVSRSQGLRSGKISLAVGIVGVVVLASMAVIGHQDQGVNSMRSSEGYVRVSSFKKLLDITQRAKEEHGNRPSENYVAYEHPEGTVEWVTKAVFRRLVTSSGKEK